MQKESKRETLLFVAVLITFRWLLENCFEFTRWSVNFRINAEHSEGTKDSVSYVSSYI
jgi:hypothetical protein